MRLHLHPSLQVIDSPFAIVSLWGAHQGVGDLAGVDPLLAECALVLRHVLSIEVMAIPAVAGSFVSALQAGKSLGEARSQVAPADAAFDPTPILGILNGRAQLVGVNDPLEPPGKPS